MPKKRKLKRLQRRAAERQNPTPPVPAAPLPHRAEPEPPTALGAALARLAPQIKPQAAPKQQQEEDDDIEALMLLL